MERHSPSSVLDSEKQKEKTCSECSMSFSSRKAMFGHLRIHRKGSKKSSLSQFREGKLSNEFLAACILMGVRRSKSETDFHDAKLSKLRWICAKIERQTKNMKEVASNQSVKQYQRRICHNVAPSLLALAGPSVGQRNRSGAAGSAAEGEFHHCDKCDKVFSTGQALGGHKRAHYTGPPICHPGSNGRSQADVGNVAAAGEAVVRDFDLNQPVNEVFP